MTYKAIWESEAATRLAHKLQEKSAKLEAVASIHTTLTLFGSAMTLAYGSASSSMSKTVSNAWKNFVVLVLFEAANRSGIRIIIIA